MEEETLIEFENFDFESNLSFQNGWSAISNIVDFNKIGIEYLKAKIFFFSKYCKPVELEKYLLWKRKTDEEPEKVNMVQQLKVEAKNSLDVVSSTIDHNDQNVHTRNEKTVVVDTNSLDNCAMPDTISDSAYDDITTKLNSTSLAQGETVTSEAESEITSDQIHLNQSEHSHDAQEDKSGSSVPLDSTKEDDAAALSLLEIATHIQNGIPIPGLVSIEVHPTNLEPTPSTRARKAKPWEISVMESVGR